MKARGFSTQHCFILLFPLIQKYNIYNTCTRIIESKLGHCGVQATCVFYYCDFLLLKFWLPAIQTHIQMYSWPKNVMRRTTYEFPNPNTRQWDGFGSSNPWNFPVLLLVQNTARSTTPPVKTGTCGQEAPISLFNYINELMYYSN